MRERGIIQARAFAGLLGLLGAHACGGDDHGGGAGGTLAQPSGGTSGQVSGGAGGTAGTGGTATGSGGGAGSAGSAGGAGGVGGARQDAGSGGSRPASCAPTVEAACPESLDDIDMAKECSACEAADTCEGPTLTDSGDGTVTSSCCGLVWQQAQMPGMHDWTSANTMCASLALNGGGYRLPTVPELRSLKDLRFLDPLAMQFTAIDPALFPDTSTGAFWTFSSYVGQSVVQGSCDQAWTVAFDTAGDGLHHFPRSALHRVRCVR